MECSCKKKIRSEEEKKVLINRINRISGQINGIKNMIEDDRYCQDVLIQLSAVEKSIKSLAGIILDHHIHSCLIDSIKNGDYSVVDEISDLFKRF